MAPHSPGIYSRAAMHRSTVRCLALVTLALLGAPVAMHVVVHDLHDHHHAHEGAALSDPAHGDHEHPIVGSSAPPLPSLTRAAVPAMTAPGAMPAFWTRIATAERNVVSFGALRTDTDVGLQPFLATFLI